MSPDYLWKLAACLGVGYAYAGLLVAVVVLAQGTRTLERTGKLSRRLSVSIQAGNGIFAFGANFALAWSLGLGFTRTVDELGGFLAFASALGTITLAIFILRKSGFFGASA
jgi:hypothetical protein